jgi:hypothetical protein
MSMITYAGGRILDWILNSLAFKAYTLITDKCLDLESFLLLKCALK